MIFNQDLDKLEDLLHDLSKSAPLMNKAYKHFKKHERMDCRGVKSFWKGCKIIDKVLCDGYTYIKKRGDHVEIKG